MTVALKKPREARVVFGEKGGYVVYCDDRSTSPYPVPTEEDLAVLFAELAIPLEDPELDPFEPYPYACDRCGYEAAGPKSLETHEATCRVPFGSFVCPFCQRTDFATPQALGAHKRYKHPGGVS